MTGGREGGQEKVREVGGVSDDGAVWFQTNVKVGCFIHLPNSSERYLDKAACCDVTKGHNQPGGTSG